MVYEIAACARAARHVYTAVAIGKLMVKPLCFARQLIDATSTKQNVVSASTTVAVYGIHSISVAT